MNPNTLPACTYCGAAAGQDCITASGNTARTTHAARRKQAADVAAGRTIVIERTIHDDDQPALFDITDGEIRTLYAIADMTDEDDFTRVNNIPYWEHYDSIRPTRRRRVIEAANRGRRALRARLVELGITEERQDRVLERATARPVAARATHSDIMAMVAELDPADGAAPTGIVARRGERILTSWGTEFRVTHTNTVVGNDGARVPAVYGTNEDGTEHGPYFANEYTIN